MQRQCAWCLRLIDDFGKRISAPVDKTYDATHGMCTVCGDIWLEEVLQDTEKQRVPLPNTTRTGVMRFSSSFRRST
ncbi:MAG TPA: hypothetical protein VFA09_09635 [Ktedonobacteraceae bacterium]|jgi:hypothetical protein|nr:hypothetical protein [Ktedonobacteraceae bacterium]